MYVMCIVCCKISKFRIALYLSVILYSIFTLFTVRRYFYINIFFYLLSLRYYIYIINMNYESVFTLKRTVHNLTWNYFTYLGRPSFSKLKKNIFLFLQKCSKPVLKISFLDQTWVIHTWNAILILCNKKWVTATPMSICYIVIAEFPRSLAISGSSNNAQFY